MSLQNEPLTSADGYAETAYRADAIPEQSYAPQNEMLRGRILETRLPWGSYLGINPTTYQYSESWFWEYQYIGDDYHDYTMINELRWSKRVDENIGILYRLLRFIFVIYSHGFSFIRTGGGGGWWMAVYGYSCIWNPAIHLCCGYMATRSHTSCHRIGFLWGRYSSSATLGKA
ncbi:hypothetical protein EI168_04865 [Halomonas sp. FME1]|uniref:Uncharacterized protein n=3 Tax=Halomonas TaxID=2745 RepID=A0ABR9F0H7_9GAMM|nr:MULTISPECIES: hypothetical protein [Halomonas]MBE0399441.1 hypothetical protein [Halomonas casei]PCC21935.1 hypothetical protein CIK78_07590 [Halomonas sp. JB37]